MNRMGNNPFSDSTINNESVVQQVINRITDAIIAGRLKPGDQLPTEMELVSTFGVSRNSLRSAIQTLRAYGVLEVRRPEGTFVRSGPSPELINPMIYNILLQKENSYQDIVALRELVDTGVSKIIVDRGLNEEDEEKLELLYENLVTELRRERYDLKRVADADKAFHVGMAECTYNSMVIMLNTFLLNITEESRFRTIRKVFEAEDREYLVKTHRDHLDALERKEGSDLEEAIKFSYYYWKDTIK